MNADCPVILIAGLSCSGKTTLARELGAILQAPVIGLDHYYFPLSHLSEAERHAVNFDRPEILDWHLIEAHVDMLRTGQAISVPRYDFVHFTRGEQSELLQPASCVIVEGQLAFFDPKLVEHSALRIYLDVPTEECFRRRVDRDVQDRGRTPEEVTWRFNSHVLPVYQEIMLPLADRASLTLAAPFNPQEQAQCVASMLNNRAILL